MFTVDHDIGIIYWSPLFIYLLKSVHLLCLGIIYWSTWITIQRTKGGCFHYCEKTLEHFPRKRNRSID